MTQASDMTLTRLAYDVPKVFESADFVSTYRVAYPKGKTGEVSNPYSTANPSEKIKIGLRAVSNEMCDFSKSYLTFEDQLQMVLTTSYANQGDFELDITANVMTRPILASGLLFNSCSERVNGNVRIRDCDRDFGLYVAPKILSHPSGIEGQSVTAYIDPLAVQPVPNPTTVQVFTSSLYTSFYGLLGFSGMNPLGYKSRAYPTLVSNLTERSTSIRIQAPNSTTPSQPWVFSYRRTVICPLHLISALATTDQLIPLGLMSQTDGDGWSIELGMYSDVRNCFTVGAVAGLSAPFGNDILSSLKYVVVKPRIIYRVVRVLNDAVNNELTKRWNSQDGEVLLIPFTNSVYEKKSLPASVNNFVNTFSVEQKGLVGIVSQMTSDIGRLYQQPNVVGPTTFVNSGIEPIISNLTPNYTSTHFEIGSLRFPDQDIYVENNPTGLRNQQAGYRDGDSYLFSAISKNFLHPKADYEQDHYPLLQMIENTASQTWKPSPLMISLESEVGDICQPINTLLVGNKVVHRGQFNKPNNQIVNPYSLPDDWAINQPQTIDMRYEFVHRDALLVANGDIRLVYNLLVVNSPDDVIPGGEDYGDQEPYE